MLKIYAIPASLYCAKLRILLRHKNLEWQEVPPPGGYGSAEYKQIVPSGNLPAMQDSNLLLADSEAIAEYLNEIHITPAMLPADATARARVRALGRFHDTRLEPALRALFPQIPPEKRDSAILKEGGKTLSSHLSVLVKLLVETDLPDDQLFVCDCGFAITFEWLAAFEHYLKLPITWPEDVQAYRNRLSRLPAIAEEYAAYRPVLTSYMQENS
ncbi:glutathione S-transferase family protein [Thalassobius sp. I31.1]|uniref:glutathione S-transferase family protein n=1 Tax=Thalassobius sp. I31.1 TaxID=2109912 RepID=UPI000D1A8752|nr:glutathione S-transferase family protein [Thalassobius sp. I31.1]